MIQVLKFEQVDTLNTGFRSYLDDLPWPFEEAVARILAVSHQRIFEQTDRYKMSFEARGKFEGSVFTLYDYKGDRRVHIGGPANLQVEDLKEALRVVLADAAPVPYEAHIHYSQGETYRWPPERPVDQSGGGKRDES